ncbi:hypothetical protein F5Y15DRAFT_431189 [Xylariaceae sp. FL0016]|nr:hypothetical protein F5Y15DRAFT_431189 [Xylariaceae sp. FL0016]
MDEYLFTEYLGTTESIPEDTHYLEILNYPNPLRSSAGTKALKGEDIEAFLARKDRFAPLTELTDSAFINGIRLLVQQNVQNQKTFDPNVVSLEKDRYEAVVRKMKLPFRALESSAAVGPFFWWTMETDRDGAQVLQMIFRKSDVRWKGTPRGCEMMLSYSFETRITSGYVKGTKSARIEKLLQQLTVCSRPVTHPMILPVLVLCRELSPQHDQLQREYREQVRQLESALSQRYDIKPADNYAPETDEDIDGVGRKLTQTQCNVLQKRPQAWQNVVSRATKAVEQFWDHLPGKDKSPDLERLQETLLGRLEFFAVKLEGLESYTHVSIERLNMQREVMHSLIDQRESRLSLRIAAQQHRLADASKKDSTSMKTLTFLGSFFLPGTFLSSVFSMSFFDFGKADQEPVSKSVWIYFVLVIPLTVLIFGCWWKIDQIYGKQAEDNEDEDEVLMNKLEDRILIGLSRRTGARVGTLRTNP